MLILSICLNNNSDRDQGPIIFYTHKHTQNDYSCICDALIKHTSLINWQ